MSTPRTDEAVCRYTGGEPVTFPKGLEPVVPISFARQLEEELNAANDAVATFKRELDRNEADTETLHERIAELEQKQKWIDEVGPKNHPDDERYWVNAYLDQRRRVMELEKDAGRYRLARSTSYGVCFWTQYAKPMWRYEQHADEHLDAAIASQAPDPSPTNPLHK